jgi:hypothetical protein
MRSNLSRRKFIENASLGFGASAIGVPHFMVEREISQTAGYSPHFVNIGIVSLMDLSATSTP